MRREADGSSADVRVSYDVDLPGAEVVSETLQAAELNNRERKNAKKARISELQPREREISTRFDAIYQRKRPSSLALDDDSTPYFF